MRHLELLDASHDRKGFDCGRTELNTYLQQVARQHLARDISRVFVIVEAEVLAPKPILGFFSLTACEGKSRLLPEALARGLPESIPAVRLGRLAVDKRMQGQGLGKDLVLLAMKTTAESALGVGVAGLFVDAKDDSLARFYGKFGFVPLPDQPLALFLPMHHLRKTLQATE